MTAISYNYIARAIYEALKGKNEAEQSQVFKKVAQFLYKKRLLSKAKDIFLCLRKVINDEEGIVVAKVGSRNGLNEKIKKELTHLLTTRYSAKEISLDEKLDEKLLGGFKIEVQDEVIDLTLKNKIGKLQEYLTRSI